MKGGQIVRYMRGSKWDKRWRPLKSHNMDCGPNCFFVLKYATREICYELARRTTSGIFSDTMIALLDDAYGPGHAWVPISEIGYNRSFAGNSNSESNNDNSYQHNSYKQINMYLSMNESTLAYVLGNEITHYFIVLKDKDGFWAIDPQSYYLFPLEEYMSWDDHLRFFIVNSKNHYRKPYEITMDIVKKHFPTYQEKERLSMARENTESRKVRNLSKKTRSRSVSRRR